LFKALEINTRLEVLSLSNTGLTDRTAEKLAEALEKNATLRVIKYSRINKPTTHKFDTDF
jgi:tropomodulin